MSAEARIAAGDRAPVAFIGLGNMGSPMADRLIAAGHRVTGFDVSEAARAQLEASGGTSATTAIDAARAADLVILMLPNSDIVEAVLTGDGGLLEAVAPGTLIVDMSSSEPLRTRALADAVVSAGARLIDAPVSGGVKGAVNGTLTIMVGGAADDAARANPVLEVLGTPTHVGPVGAGHALKSINNLMSASHLWVTSEAMLTGMAFGLDPEVMLAAINRSSGRSGSTEHKWPNFIVGETYDSGFALALMLKDMRIATGLAERLGIPHTVSDVVVEHWGAASEELGAGADHTEVARWLRRRLPEADREQTAAAPGATDQEQERAS
ncbi:NAD(P)-dependent oxidoreductase [Agromyces aerolatus]|uniref:NAD(P)-dependent oxidoreductase n=1 Tax=Agromyces sp. LY-1074 TaxID=3074080 RepID=UPI0028615414|nr:MULTISPECIES: NAD(P)-dependent oxidoreductase [unclassified Agromyces]MDR5698701.1 NAD(P)-dependent oxidoreductase [Agromyces sp. LY-1074]MDR5704995.1 NAD(P)-dependent oxidoreductase [Agromyces sp. LY-1358]